MLLSRCCCCCSIYTEPKQRAVWCHVTQHGSLCHFCAHARNTCGFDTTLFCWEAELLSAGAQETRFWGEVSCWTRFTLWPCRSFLLSYSSEGRLCAEQFCTTLNKPWIISRPQMVGDHFVSGSWWDLYLQDQLCTINPSVLSGVSGLFVQNSVGRVCREL